MHLTLSVPQHGSDLGTIGEIYVKNENKKKLFNTY